MALAVGDSFGYAFSSFCVFLELPPKVLKTELQNHTPVSFSRPPGGKGVFGSEPGKGAFEKEIDQAEWTLHR